MNKSELKRHIIEALTPQEADKVDSKYKEIYGGMLKGNKKKLMKYIDPESGRPNPDKVAYGRAIKLIQKESANLKEKLGKDADLGDHIEDFQKSDAKQFQGKSKKKIKQMATAAFLNKEEQKLDEIDTIMEEDKIPVDKLEKKVKSILKKEGGAVGLKPLVDAAKELGATKKDLMGILKKMKDVKTHKDGDIIDTDGLNETGMDKAKKNMDMYKDKNRLQELIKSALMGPMNENRYDINDPNSPMGKLNDEYESSGLKSIVDKYGLDVVLMMLSSGEYGDRLNESKKKQRPDYPDIDGDGDTKEPMVKAAKDKEKAEANESFDSLVKKVDKSKGYTKKEAEKVAGAIAAKKRAGAGKGPTAKQKKRMAETILKELRGNVNEALNKDLKTFGGDLKKFMEEKGLKVELKQGNSQPLYNPIGQNSDFAALNLQDDNLHVIVNDSKVDVLKDIIKKYSLKTLQALKQTGGWADDPKKKAQSKGEIYLTQELKQGRKGKAFELVISRFDPSTIK